MTDVNADHDQEYGLTNRRSFLRGTAIVGLGLAAGTSVAGTAAASTAQAGSGNAHHGPRHHGRHSFVRARRGRFELNGDRWSVAGTNNYYLHYKSHLMIDDVLDDAVAMGLNTIRTWGWIDGPESDGVSLQPEPYVYPEEAYERFDYAVAGARRRGLRLVVPLTNNWDAFGGIPQYVSWFGAADHDDFYRRADIKACYRAYVKHFLGRRNRYTGLRYHDEPTVMTWELANEPRCPSDKTGDTLVAWADEMSRYVKRHAPRQLVAVGDEGFFGRAGDPDYPYSDYEGVSWQRLTALKAVDYGTVHLYPDSWGETEKDVWGSTWIADHIRAGHRLGKPVVIEEFGLKDDSADQATRNAVYRHWTDTVVERNGDGDHFWILTGIQDDGTLYPDYDGFRVTTPSSTATLLTQHARQLARRDARIRR